MAKHMMRGWMWAGALAGTLALGTACSSTEAPVMVAQADTTGQPATGGSGSTTNPDNPTQSSPATPGTVPGTPSENPGSTPTPDTMNPSTTTTTPGTDTTAPGTTSTAPGTPSTMTGDAGMGGSGVEPVVPDTTTDDTFQPPAGGAVLDGGTGY